MTRSIAQLCFKEILLFEWLVSSRNEAMLAFAESLVPDYGPGFLDCLFFVHIPS